MTHRELIQKYIERRAEEIKDNLFADPECACKQCAGELADMLIEAVHALERAQRDLESGDIFVLDRVDKALAKIEEMLK